MPPTTRSRGLTKTLDISMVDESHLAKLGVTRKHLTIPPKPIDEVIEAIPQALQNSVDASKERLLAIYDHWNLHCSVRRLAELIVSPVLLVLSLMDRDTEGNPGTPQFVTVHELSLTSEDSHSKGCKLMNPVTGYELWLTGSLDYLLAKCPYQGELEYRGHRHRHHAKIEALGSYMAVFDRVRSSTVTKEAVFRIMDGCPHFLLVQAKRDPGEGKRFAEVPEAVMQALLVAEHSGEETVRFCLTNGMLWRFYLLRKVDVNWVYYESDDLELKLETLRDSDRELSKIFLLITEWLSPTIPNLYVLDDDVLSTQH